MAWLLGIETATHVCSVALSREGKTLFLRESEDTNAHSRLLAGFIHDLFSEAGISAADLGAVVVSKGPGSYTGPRIGVSTAKGLCYGQNLPLIAVSTLHSMALGAREKHPEAGLFCPMIDARRMEVYSAIFNTSLETVMDTAALIVDEQTYAPYLMESGILFFGSGAAKCHEVITHPNARFDYGLQPSARYLSQIGWEKFLRKDFKDVAYFEPFYLKDFIAGKPRVKGLFD
ncbi:MAG: tRNA (adenosine(37)-N6)-threonylcarbamoyltransferase complex dimerization subunit type 1 TsaB [Bacteroidales bacterium]|nr:tRNA (adenosine(37)-N6)-threonylcarbamoyltransferase complex dimerization subunit type 1 TsaB [Bacteroidales bacterium]